MATKKKIIGLSCGRIKGNSEILLKESLIGAQEEGIDSEIIRAMELRIKPCTGCEACFMAAIRGKEVKCIITDDDVEWILEKLLVEADAMIVSGPLYHLRPNAYFESIHDRMLSILYRYPEIENKMRVGGIISLGGSEPAWTTLGLAGFNVFMLNFTKVVDQMQVNGCGRPGTVTMREEYINHAHQLGKNVAKAMKLPSRKIKYLGPQSEFSCPLCHVNLAIIPDKLPTLYCPICWVKGEIKMYDGNMKVVWDMESLKAPRYSKRGLAPHREFLTRCQMQWIRKDQKVGKERMKKYENWGKVVKP